MPALPCQRQVPDTLTPLLPEGEAGIPSDLNRVKKHIQAFSSREQLCQGEQTPRGCQNATSLKHKHIQQTPSASGPSGHLRKREAEDSREHNQNLYISVVYKLSKLQMVLVTVAIVVCSPNRRVPLPLSEKAGLPQES